MGPAVRRPTSMGPRRTRSAAPVRTSISMAPVARVPVSAPDPITHPAARGTRTNAVSSRGSGSAYRRTAAAPFSIVRGRVRSVTSSAPGCVSMPAIPICVRPAIRPPTGAPPSVVPAVRATARGIACPRHARRAAPATRAPGTARPAAIRSTVKSAQPTASPASWTRPGRGVAPGGAAAPTPMRALTCSVRSAARRMATAAPRAATAARSCASMAPARALVAL